MVVVRGGEKRGVVERGTSGGEGDEWWRGDEGEGGKDVGGRVPPLFCSVEETRKISDPLEDSCAVASSSTAPGTAPATVEGGEGADADDSKAPPVDKEVIHPKLVEAEQLMHEAVRVYEVTCGAESPLTCTAYTELGQLQWKVGKRFEARANLEKGYRIAIRKDHLDIVQLMDVHNTLVQTLTAKMKVGGGGVAGSFPLGSCRIMSRNNMYPLVLRQDYCWLQLPTRSGSTSHPLKNDGGFSGWDSGGQRLVALVGDSVFFRPPALQTIDRTQFREFRSLIDEGVQRIEQVPKQDGNTGVYYKLAGEFRAWGGDYGDALKLLILAKALFEKETSCDCSKLIREADEMIGYCTRCLSGKQDSPMELPVQKSSQQSSSSSCANPPAKSDDHGEERCASPAE